MTADDVEKCIGNIKDKISLPGSLAKKPVEKWGSIVLLTFGVIANYADIASDIYVLTLYYSREEYRYFTLALTIVAIPYIINVLTSFSRHIIFKCSAVFMLDMLLEFIGALLTKFQRANVAHLKLLESLVEGCPSSLLQLFVLVRRAVDNDTSLVSNTSDAIVIISLCISKLLTSMNLSTYSTDQSQVKQIAENLSLPPWSIKFNFGCHEVVLTEDLSLSLVQFGVLPLYHISSEVFRLVTVCGLFLSLRAFGLVFLVPAFLVRFWFIFFKYEVGNSTKLFSMDQMTPVLLSLESDIIWSANRPLTIACQILTSIEGLVFTLIMLFSNIYFNSPSFQKGIALTSLVAWILKTCLYLLTYFQIDTDKCSTYHTVKKVDENANKESQLVQEIEVVKIDI